MSPDENLRSSVVSFLSRNGWEEVSRGTAGTLWARGRGPDAQPVAVPNAIPPQSRELTAIAATIAPDLGAEPSGVQYLIEREFLDLSLLRIEDVHLVAGTAPLQGAAGVLTSAFGIYRAIATTQRRPRSYIGSGYSRRGDKIAARARLGHTRIGSFVLPVGVPVEPLQADEGTIAGTERDVEPEERELSRSVASALGVLDSIAAGPDQDLTPEETQALIASGVSYEVVRAVKEVIEDPRVGKFEATFEWAGALLVPKSVPSRVAIGHDAQARLDRIATNLRNVSEVRERTFSGQIVDIFYREGADSGYIKVESSPLGRRADVEVTVGAEIIQDVLLWKRQKRTLLVVGGITKAPGGTLTVPNPSRVAPLDELFRASEIPS